MGKLEEVDESSVLSAVGLSLAEVVFWKNELVEVQESVEVGFSLGNIGVSGSVSLELLEFAEGKIVEE